MTEHGGADVKRGRPATSNSDSDRVGGRASAEGNGTGGWDHDVDYTSEGESIHAPDLRGRRGGGLPGSRSQAALRGRETVGRGHEALPDGKGHEGVLQELGRGGFSR